MKMFIVVSMFFNAILMTSSLPRYHQSNCYNKKLAIADIARCVNMELGFSDRHAVENHHHRQRRVASTDIHRKWPKHTDGFVYIPIKYTANDSKGICGELCREFSFSGWYPEIRHYLISNISLVIETMESGMRIFHEKTCVRFVPQNSTHKDYISIVSNNGCYSKIGCHGGEQIISIQASSACLKTGIAVHEFLHALGFYHEMRRCDRDDYVIVNMKNIWDNRRYQFAKLDCKNTTTYNETYDITSILHYGNYADAIDYDVMTITSKRDPKEKLGQSEEMSHTDIEAVNRRYNCESYLARNSR